MVHRLLTVLVVRIYRNQLLSLVIYQQVLFEFLGLKLIWKADIIDLNLLDVLQSIIINDYLIKDRELKIIICSSRSIAAPRTWSPMPIVVNFVICQDEHHLLGNAQLVLICDFESIYVPSFANLSLASFAFIQSIFVISWGLV